MLLEAGEVDAALCGGLGDWTRQLSNILPIIPRQRGVSRLYSLSALILPNGALFFCDTHVNVDPTAEQIAEMTLLAAKSRAPLRPRPQGGAAVAFQLRHLPFAQRPQDARGAGACCAPREPDFEMDGEMHADAALSEACAAAWSPPARSPARPICW